MESTPCVVPLDHLASFGGVSSSELACLFASTKISSSEAYLLGKLLLSAHAQRLVGALSIVAIRGSTRMLGSWLDEQALVLGSMNGISLDDRLPLAVELRKAIGLSLEPYLDATCVSRLARVSQLRLTSWPSDADDLEESLEDELSEKLIRSRGLARNAGCTSSPTSLRPHPRVCP